MHLNAIFIGLLVIGFIRIGEAQREQYNQNQEAECRIYSSPLKRYLYAEWKFLGLVSRRSMGLWKELESWGMYNAVPDYQYDEKDESGLWLFESIPGRPRTYFIRNKKYKNEYLRGSEKYAEYISRENRAVYVEKFKNQVDDESFMWRIEATSEMNVYHIWNVKLNRAFFSNELFGAIFMTDYKKNNRQPFRIGLSPKQPDSEDFKWIFKCRDGIFPNF